MLTTNGAQTKARAESVCRLTEEKATLTASSRQPVHSFAYGNNNVTVWKHAAKISCNRRKMFMYVLCNDP